MREGPIDVNMYRRPKDPKEAAEEAAAEQLLQQWAKNKNAYGGEVSSKMWGLMVKQMVAKAEQGLSSDEPRDLK